MIICFFCELKMYGRLYLYTYVVSRLLGFCMAGLDGQFFNMLYDRFKEDTRVPHHFTPDMYPELNSQLYQGDIMVPISRNAIMSEYYKWPKAIIPYVIHSNFTMDERSKIRLAMDTIESRTCLRFVDKNNSVAVGDVGHSEYLHIARERKKGCYAMIGYHQNLGTPHMMNLEAPPCLTHQGTIQHELLHVVGLLHEQARYDRDNAVIIYWENIDKTYWPDFNKVPDNLTTTFGLPYDYTSVMHYPRYAFSKNGKETIVAKHDTSMALGQRIGATATDLRKVNSMYSCNGVGSTSNTNTGGYQNQVLIQGKLISEQEKKQFLENYITDCVIGHLHNIFEESSLQILTSTTLGRTCSKRDVVIVYNLRK